MEKLLLKLVTTLVASQIMPTILRISLKSLSGGVENSLHWVLDVALSEDDCRIERQRQSGEFWW